MRSKIRAILYKIGFYLLAILTLGTSAVYAATTISTNVSTGGTVTASGPIYANGNIDRTLYDTLTIGSTTSSAVTIGGSSALLESITLLPAATGTILIGGTSQTGAITFGRSTDSQTINIGNGAVATTKTATINIGGGASVGNTVITIGSASANSTLNLKAGDSGLMVNATTTILNGFIVAPTAAGATTTIGATGQTGTITLGQSTDSNIINIGNGAAATTKTQTINIGAGTTVGNAAITIGSASGGSALTLTAGTGGLSITATTTLSRHLISGVNSAAPVVVVGSDGMSSATSTNGTDTKGTVTTTPTSANPVTVELDFATNYSVPPVCVLTAANTSSLLNVTSTYVTSTVSGMGIRYSASPLAASLGSPHVWNYHCIQ